MASPAQISSLSLSARLLCYLGPPSAILLTAAASPSTGLLSPLALLPTAFFYKKWQKANSQDPSCRGELEPMIWTYIVTGTIGLTAAGLLQMGICQTASLAIFSSAKLRKEFFKEFFRATIKDLSVDELARRAVIAATWQNWVFNLVLCFLSAGAVEEALKFLPILLAKRRGTTEQKKQRNEAYLDYVIAGALGFGLVESIGFLYAACTGAHETWSQILVTLAQRLTLSQLGHLSCAALTGLRAIQKDYCGEKISWLGVIGPAVLLHGTFDFIAMSGSALGGNVGWIYPSDTKILTGLLGMITTLVGIAVWQVKREWKIIQSFKNKSRKEKK